jgi:hypothetical protein
MTDMSSNSVRDLYMTAHEYDYDVIRLATVKALGWGDAAMDMDAIEINVDSANYTSVDVTAREATIRGITAWGFSLVTFPGCPAIVISTSTFVHERVRGKGLGRLLRLTKDAICQRAGFDEVQCTVDVDNHAQVHILLTDGWQSINEQVNTSTEHLVRQYKKSLRKKD